MGKVVTAASAVTVLLLTLSGCTEPPPPVGSVPAPSETPVFASDEEALAAAEAAYARYLEVSDRIFAEGGIDPDRLQEVTSREFLATSISGFERVQSNGWHSVGVSTFDSIELQQYDAGARLDALTVYLCDDVSGVDVLGVDGASVVSPDRPSRTLFQVTFDLDPRANTLLVSGQEVWGDGSC